MTKSDHVVFWSTASNIDWEVAENLFEKNNFPQSLFFGHLVLEKLLKAHWIKDNSGDFPPRIHNLIRLSNQTTLIFIPDDLLILDRMNDFQMEGRYPDYNFTIYRICTPEYTREILNEVNRIRTWLINQLL